MERWTICLILALIIALPAVAQTGSAEEEVIKTTLRDHTQHLLDRNLESIRAGWLHDAKATRTVITKYGYSQLTGWDKIDAMYTRAVETNPEPTAGTLRSSNHVIRVDGNVASAEYDQELLDSKGEVTRRTRELRTLVKQDGHWKIASMTIMGKMGYGDTDEDVEANVNAVGYHLLNTGRTAEAIEIFKLNVAMFPEAWNTYDSLGEAYMKANKKKAAIKNYQRSVELNPENKGGREALAKLASM